MVARRTAPLPVAGLLSLAVVGAMLGGCTPSRIDSARDERLAGDADLLGQVESTFADRFDRAAVAVVDGDEVRTAFVAADESTVFEIGSITKALTGELLAIAIERDEVALGDPLGAHLDLGDAPVASVSLQALATHHGGIPSLPTDPEWVASFDRAIAAGKDPSDDDLDDLLELAHDLEVRAEAEFEYSNIGAALLGHALASAAGTTYPDLLTERILDPLGMDHAVLVDTPEQVPEAHAGGFTDAGDPVEAWSIGAFSPAGGVHATLGDLVALAQAVVDGGLARSAALEPIADTDGRDWRVGYYWFVVEERPRTLTVIEGETGGFTSSVVINRDAGTAAVVLSNSTGSDLYHLALRLLVAAEQ